MREDSQARPNRTTRLLWMLGVLIVVILFAGRFLIVQHHLAQARNAVRQREFHRAIDWLESARRWRETAEVHFLLARTYRRMGSDNRFEQHINQAQALGLADHRVLREQTLALTQAGKLAMNDPLIGELLNGDESDILEVYEAIVQGAFTLYETELAITLLDSWQAGFPLDSQPHYYRGLFYEYEEDWAKAEASFRESLALDEGRTDVRASVARTLWKQNRYHEALQQYRRCLTESSDADVWHGVGKCLKMRGLVDDARDAFEKGLANNSRHYKCLLGRGQLEIDAGRGREAIPWLSKALEQKPHEFEVLYAIAQAYHFTGQTVRATKFFELASASYAASVHVRSLTEFLAEHPHDLEKRFEIGTTLIEHGQWDVGVSWLRGVLKVDPAHQATHRILADFYSRQGKAELAARHRQQLE